MSFLFFFLVGYIIINVIIAIPFLLSYYLLVVTRLFETDDLCITFTCIFSVGKKRRVLTSRQNKSVKCVCKVIMRHNSYNMTIVNKQKILNKSFETEKESARGIKQYLEINNILTKLLSLLKTEIFF